MGLVLGSPCRFMLIRSPNCMLDPRAVNIALAAAAWLVVPLGVIENWAWPWVINGVQMPLTSSSPNDG
uniref:Uncharacterized protein n=1 Tax=uncultured marine virus TaxID=186617 RepID=A0A0F7L8S0_9VIRU|nr:hypothetical protein [uncultured marine virus]